VQLAGFRGIPRLVAGSRAPGLRGRTRRRPPPRIYAKYEGLWIQVAPDAVSCTRWARCATALPRRQASGDHGTGRAHDPRQRSGERWAEAGTGHERRFHVGHIKESVSLTTARPNGALAFTPSLEMFDAPALGYNVGRAGQLPMSAGHWHRGPPAGTFTTAPSAHTAARRLVHLDAFLCLHSNAARVYVDEQGPGRPTARSGPPFVS